jgi:hypothetical protein
MVKKLLPLLLIPAAIFADEAYDIAKKAETTQRNFGDETVESTMSLIAANGSVVTRKTKNFTLERAGNRDYQLIQFLEPADVRGTSLLTHQDPKGDDSQWLYLPELRRVKRISSTGKTGSFMGSEFTYEDIGGNTLDKFKYTRLPDETYKGKPCYVLEKTPNYENSGYTKIKMWVAKDSNLLLRQDFFDRKSSLLKVMTFEGHQQYGSTWRSARIAVENLQTKKKSVLDFTSRKMRSGLSGDLFTERNLQRLQ